MANENEVNVLMSIDLDASETLKTIAALRTETAGFRQQQKMLDRATADGAVEYERLNTRIKANTKTIQQYEKAVVNTIKRDEYAAGSIKRMRAELSSAKAAYDALSKAEREGAKGQELLEHTAALNAELKELEGAYGDNQRKVGEYERAGVSLRTEMRTLVQTLTEMKVAGQDNSAEYQEMAGRLAELRDAMGDVNQQANLLASDTRSFDTMMEGARAVTAAYSVWKTTTQALGIENESLEATMQKMMVAMGALQALTELQNIAQKQSNLYRAAATVIDKLRIKNIQAETTAVVGQTVATKAATVVARIWNTVLSSNPVLLLVTAVTGLVAVVTALSGRMSEQRSNVAGLKAEYDRFNSSMSETVRLQDLQIEKMRILGATETEIARQRLANANANEAAGGEQLYRLEQRLKRLQDTKLPFDGNRAAIKELREEIDGLTETQKGLTTTTKDAQAAFDLSVFRDEVEATKNDVSTSVKDTVNTVKDAADEIYNDALRRSELMQRVSEAQFKAESDGLDDSIKERLAHEAELFRIQRDGAAERLELQRQNGKITAEEYKANLDILNAEQKAFANKQTEDLNAFFVSEREAIIGMVEQTFEEEIIAVENKYADAIRRLNETQIGETEAAQLEMANIVIRLEQQRADEVARIRDAAAAEEQQRISDAQQSEYQIISSTLNRELFDARSNAKKIYDAKVKALNAESEIYKDNADRQLEIQRGLADAETELIDTRLEKFNEWANAAQQLFDGMNSLMSAGIEAQLQEIQTAYDAENAALADKYALGVLTEAEYNRETLKLEQQKAKDEAKIERQRAIRERAGKVFSVVTDTAMGIVKAVAASPLTGGLPWSAIVAAIGALNLATILSEPLPKAARGGLITGPSHRAGGTVIEAEGGEAIMTRRAVSMFGPVLSALNELGGGVPFAGPLSDGGYILRSASGERSTSADEMAEVLKSIKIYTTVEDINRGQDQYAKIQARGTVLE